MAMPKYQMEAKLKEEHELIDKGILRDENPLDLSEDFEKLIGACRLGDLKQCQELISAGANINGKDKFDYTPLIIASLCGHYEVAQLLLESGALAERNTFQGERCLYNALNDRMRRLLLQYEYSKSSDPLQPWAAYVTSLLGSPTPATSDIRVTASAGPGLADETFRLHKFFLAARTPYFRRKLADAPGLASFSLAGPAAAKAFRIVLHYLYLDDVAGQVAALGDDDDDDDDELLFKQMGKITRQLEIEELWETIRASSDRRLARQRYEDEVQRAQQQVAHVFRQHVVGNKMTVDARKVDDVKWPHGNFIFADCLLCAEEDDDVTDEVVDKPATSIPVGPGVATQPKTRRAVLYPAHKAFLVRSDYFRTMFSSAFREATDGEHLHIIRMDCAPDVLEILLSFLYTETAEIPLAPALDVLYVADMLFLDKLKAKAAAMISTLGSGDRGRRGRDHDIDIFEVLRAAWDLKVQRLETFAGRFLADRLEHYIDDARFADAVRESAHRLKTRQATDSIELVDDIRYFLAERFRLGFKDVGLDLGEDEEDKSDSNETDNGKADTPLQGRVQTLDGQYVEDDIDMDAINHDVLLAKIDALLERLGLDG